MTVGPVRVDVWYDDPNRSTAGQRIMHGDSASRDRFNGDFGRTLEFTAENAGDYYFKLGSYIAISVEDSQGEYQTVSGTHEYGVTLVKTREALPDMSGPDRLVGNVKGEVLEGGEGDDTYIVSARGVRVVEGPREGTDSVFSSVDFWMGSYLDDLSLTGSKAVTGAGNDMHNVIAGNQIGNILKGKDGNDTLKGWGGDDRLEGGRGADKMFGGKGNDRYLVDDLDDKVIEAPGAGIDTVVATTYHQLGGHVENLILRADWGIDGDGNSQDNRIEGTSGDNELRGAPGDDTLIGWGGDDRLHGGWGADKMFGGKGDDTYFVDNVGDKVIEAPHTGEDTVYSQVSYTLAQSLEHLGLEGLREINGTGNAKANQITGNDVSNLLSGLGGNDELWGHRGHDTLRGGAGNDEIHGGDGRDVLIGGHGADHLEGGAGADRFVFAGNDGRGNDIWDFEPGVDKIVITSGARSFADIDTVGRMVEIESAAWNLSIRMSYADEVASKGYEMSADDFIFV
ncbi:calcium-binding protein [Paracoccus isoporae]|uniref:calcium-binding protein n=1 Tax=Paracoccus isoporae TaxID=591205 RepID=UPI0015A0879B|nr:calcium-binding protein [Paracoccus isoporae]